MSLFSHYDDIRMGRELSMLQTTNRLGITYPALCVLKKAVMRYDQKQFEHGIPRRDTGIDEDLGYREKMEFIFDIEIFVRWLEACPDVVTNGFNSAINVNATIGKLDRVRVATTAKWAALDHATKPEPAHV